MAGQRTPLHCSLRSVWVLMIAVLTLLFSSSAESFSAPCLASAKVRYRMARGLLSTPCVGACCAVCNLNRPGLLSTADDKFYACQLTSEDVHFFTKFGAFWDAAEADAVTHNFASPELYLEHVIERCEEFFIEATVWDRDHLQEVLRRMLIRKGVFALFVGGKSVGKTLLLKEIATNSSEDTPQRVAMVNARKSGTDLAEGIFQAVATFPPEWINGFRDLVVAAQGVAATVTPVLKMPNPAALLKEVLGVVDRMPTAEETLTAFVKAAHARGEFPVLIVDEANLLFSPNARANKQVLDLLVSLTKEEQVLNVLFVSSEHGYPFKLRDGLNFNLANIGRVVHAGEVAPNKMLQLLEEQWGMGEQLAQCFVGAYGGHIWQSATALDLLLLHKEDYVAYMGVQMQLNNAIEACIRAEGSLPGFAKFLLRRPFRGTVSLLRKLAVDGFVPISSDADKRAELLCEKGVAGYVEATHAVPGLPPKAWKGGAEQGLIPSSQMVRMLIMRKLVLSKRSVEK